MLLRGTTCFVLISHVEFSKCISLLRAVTFLFAGSSELINSAPRNSSKHFRFPSALKGNSLDKSFCRALSVTGPISTNCLQ